MKTATILTSALLIVLSSYSQNVGIGTLSPQARLDIRSFADAENPTLMITDSASKGLGLFRFQNSSFAGKFMEFSGYKSQPSSKETYLFLRSDSAYIATFKGDGSVGINNGSPTERLDVDGNINLTGTIKANGTDGLPNQVLMKNGSGALAWGDVNGSAAATPVDNVAIFFATSSGATQNWMPPAGVTKITIEIWGAGGRGGSNSGGAGGGYAKGNFTVDPGKSISMIVGLPTGSVGETSSVTVEGVTLFATGGKAASESYEDGYPIPEGGFYGYSGSLFRNFTGVPGESGTASFESTSQYSATEFRLFRKVGNGGDAGNSSNTGARGGQVVFLLPGGGTFDATRAAIARVPGGGGAAQNGSAGAAGLIVVHY